MPQILGQEIGPIGYGLMGLTWRPNPQPEEESFKAMRASLEQGANFWNAGEFYGTPELNSLTLLKNYFTRYPEDAERVVLSVKSGITKSMAPDGSPEFIKTCIDNCMRLLGGTKKIDVFECARVDKNTPIEVTMKALESHVKNGDIGGISLSEVSAATIEKAAKVTKIVAVEVELSLFSLDVLKNGVAATCAKYDIPLVAYSPIGRGMLTGEIKSPDDIPEGDMRRHMPRFSKENFSNNLKLVEALQGIAKEKGVTPAQLAIAWVRAQSKQNGNPEINPIPGATSVSRVKENSENVQLSPTELTKIEKFLESFEVAGTRYPEAHMSHCEV